MKIKLYMYEEDGRAHPISWFESGDYYEITEWGGDSCCYCYNYDIVECNSDGSEENRNTWYD